MLNVISCNKFKSDQIKSNQFLTHNNKNSKSFPDSLTVFFSSWLPIIFFPDRSEQKPFLKKLKLFLDINFSEIFRVFRETATVFFRNGTKVFVIGLLTKIIKAGFFINSSRLVNGKQKLGFLDIEAPCIHLIETCGFDLE